ncbi:MAG: DUF4349 domain-containing protein [Saonia sp.]
MKQVMKRKLKRIITILLLGFIALFVFRLMYGFNKVIENTPDQIQFFETISTLRKNYASKEYKISNSGQSPVKVDQKYEKIAEINTTSTQFDQEEKRVREKIKSFDALIQFEQKSGNKDHRKLNLLIGVPPQNFDSIYKDLIKIGKVKGKQIIKTDKTNEYNELNAKKSSLEKIRASLIVLKSKGGKIEEYMQLENRILEIEQQLQALGVSLGNFDDENEFCTVRLSLWEGKVSKITFLQRTKVALEWTVNIYLRIMVVLFFIALSAYMMLLAVEKLQLLERITKKNE